MRYVQQDVKETAGQEIPLWRNGDFLLLWGGQTISAVGNSISTLSFPLLILFLTKSPGQLGLISAVSVLPYITLSLFAGALIDRLNRKLVMICCDIGRMVNVASIPLALWLGHLTIAQIYIMAVFEGILFVFFNLASSAALPRLVGRRQLTEATAVYQTSDNLASFVGSPLGGLLYAISPACPFIADAISYGTSVLSLSLIKGPFQLKQARSASKNIGQEVQAGLLWLWRHPVVRFLAFLTASFGLVAFSNTIVLVVLAQRQDASPTLIGALLTAIGVGSFLGTLAGPVLSKRLPSHIVIIGTLVLAACCCLLYVVIHTLWVLAFICTSISFLWSLYSVVQFSYRLSLIPDELQGRVNSVFRLLVFVFRLFGQIAIGALLQYQSARALLTGIGLYFAVLAGITLLNPRMRAAGSTQTMEV